jgi:hypothetical protein
MISGRQKKMDIVDGQELASLAYSLAEASLGSRSTDVPPACSTARSTPLIPSSLFKRFERSACPTFLLFVPRAMWELSQGL